LRVICFLSFLCLSNLTFGATSEGDVSAPTSVSHPVGSFPTFTADEIALMPSVMGITTELVTELLVGPVDLNGREWSIFQMKDMDAFRSIVEDGPASFDVEPLNGDPLVCAPFKLDVNNKWIADISIVHASKTFDTGEPLCFAFTVMTELKDSEKTHPFFQSIRWTKPIESLEGISHEDVRYKQFCIDYMFPILGRCLGNDDEKKQINEAISQFQTEIASA
jgi:hypothetical protein